MLDEQRPARAVVVGGGYIGLEMAEALRMRGCKVALVEQAPQLMLTLDPDMAEGIAERLVAEGIELHLDEALRGPRPAAPRTVCPSGWPMV